MPLDADLTRLAQVFSNLLTNSAKYTDRGGHIWLTAERCEVEVAISARDTGIGIPADALPRLFDMFSQVDRSIERSTGGLGIGLALVKALTEMHGGTVVAESDGPGRGSTFTVRLPLAESRAAPVQGLGNSPSPSGTARRTLVVDDSRDGECLRLANTPDPIDRGETSREWMNPISASEAPATMSAITILGSARRACTGPTRRETLKVGALSLLGVPR